MADLVTGVRIDRWERAADGAILEGLMTVEDLAARGDAYAASRRKGIGTLRALVDHRRADAWVPPESELEVLLRRAVDLAPSRPRVRWQAAMPWGAAGEGRVDGLADEWAVVLEADGRRWHTRVADFDNDRWRDNVAASCGLRVVRFTYLHLTQRLDEVIDLIEQVGRSTFANRAS
jgi:very-short-patch-repair endonuclease